MSCETHAIRCSPQMPFMGKQKESVLRQKQIFSVVILYFDYLFSAFFALSLCLFQKKYYLCTIQEKEAKPNKKHKLWKQKKC